MVTTRPPKTIVKPTALGPVANTDTKLLIYGLFQKGRVLAQDGVGGDFLSLLLAADPDSRETIGAHRLHHSIVRSRGGRPVPKLGSFEIDHKSAA